MTFLYPEALLLGLLLIVLYFRFVKTRNPWRTAMVFIVALLLAYPSFRIRSRSLDLFILLDRSKSIPEEGIAKQSELLGLISDKLEPGDRVSVVSFKEKGYVEQPLGPGPARREMASPFSDDASDLTDGLATVMSMVADKRQSRIFVMSDGEYTGQDPTPQAQVARQLGVPIFVRDLKRLDVQNLFVTGVDTDEKLLTNEPFRVLFRVNSTVDIPGRYRVYRNDKIAGEDRDNGWRAFDFKAGENRIAFTDSVGVPGIHGYRIEVETTPASAEKITTDNMGDRYVNVVGERPLLIVNNDGQPDNITAILRAGGIPIHVVSIGNYRMDINQLSGYKGVILNNVPITSLPKNHIDDIARFVTQEGGGLLVAGGNRSFGAGGYFRTAVEDVLPVSLEDRRQNKKISGAFSYVLDRSGSMAMTVPSGETKMDVANAAAVEALGLLSGADSLSVIAVDSAAHIFVNQQPATDVAGISSRIRSIRSEGGGIFVYTGLVAAGSQIAGAPQANKHVLLFADAADAEEPGDYKKLLKDFTEAGISVSVVGLGSEQDSDADFLKDVAKLGNGQVYFTQDPGQLVQFFTADTIQYTRKNFIEDAAPMKIMPGAFMISPEQKWKDFSSAGYNLLFPRENADVAIITNNGDNSPVLAFWQKGVGRAATLALDASGEFGSHADYPDIMLSAARWIMGSDVNDSFQVQTRTEGNYARISMEVSDEERAAMGQARLIMYAPDGTTVERPLQWDTWNRLSADVRLNQTGAWRGLIQMGEKSYRVGPVSMPVSPEFAYRGDAASGAETLQQLATLSGGKELTDINPLFERKRATVSTEPLVFPLLILLLLCLLGEIAEARFGMLSALMRRLKGGAVGQKLAEAADGVTTAWETRNEARLKPRRKQKPTREEKQHAATKTVRPAPAAVKPETSAAPPQAKPAEKSQPPPESTGSLDQVIEQARRRRK